MSKNVCVIGLGYIGLPTAATFAAHGLQVLGVDVNETVLETVNNGNAHIHEPGLETLLLAALRSGNLCVAQAPTEADAFIIAVPTPIRDDKTADMSAVTAAAQSIVPHLRRGNLVLLESTSPPRTTVDLLLPILEESGLKAGTEFYLAYSPERVLPGRILQELLDNARVVGGIDRPSAEAARDLYRTFVKGDIVLTDSTTAEMVKLMENTYRDVNIAIANEFSRLADRFGVDVWEAIRTANLHPRVNILTPGPGVGGHCISVDPWFLVEGAPDTARLIRTAREVNDAQPAFMVTLLKRMVGDLYNRRIAALGLTYKEDVSDFRESAAIRVVTLLAQAGAMVRAYDPYARGKTIPGVTVVDSLQESLIDADALLLLVRHREFQEMRPAQIASLTPVRLIFDGTGTCVPEDWKQHEFHVFGLGRKAALHEWKE